LLSGSISVQSCLDQGTAKLPARLDKLGRLKICFVCLSVSPLAVAHIRELVTEGIDIRH